MSDTPSEMSENVQMVRGMCPSCRGNRRAFILGQGNKQLVNKYGLVANDVIGRLLECAGCEEIYFQKEVYRRAIDFETETEEEAGSFFGPEFQHWPSAGLRPFPTWANQLKQIEPDLYEWLSDTYFSLDNGRYAIAAISIRTTIDLSLIKTGCPEGLRFVEKVSWAVEKQLILPSERNAFSTLIDAGSAATHRGWRADFDQIEKIVTQFEVFLHRMFFIADESKNLASSIPKRE